MLGLSGGIDSALVACLAADALGAERVNVAIMPSPYSSEATQDGRPRARRGRSACALHELPIDAVFEAYRGCCATSSRGAREDVGATGPPRAQRDLTEENLQARIRGNLLMALSNKFGWLVLTTGNKSEMSVGYTTLYGDLAGGFAVIKDVPKTLVYRLARWRNSPLARRSGRRRGHRAARRSRTRSSSARPRRSCAHDQRDEDSLPPYEVLDRILHGYIELDHEPRAADRPGPAGRRTSSARSGSSTAPSTSAARRRPGIKITTRAFGRDRRMPITNRYRG